MSIVEDVIKAYGGVKAVQERFGYKSSMSVYVWRKRGIPKNKIVEIYQDTGLDLQSLNKSAQT